MSVTRFPKGISTASTSKSPLANLPEIDPTKLISWWDDFFDWDASQWEIVTTENTAGNATEVLNDEVGGVLKLTLDDNDDDNTFLFWSGEESSTATEVMKITDSEKAWFKARFKVNEATQSEFIMGLQQDNGTPISIKNGILFQKDDGNTELDFHVTKDSTQSSLTNIHTVEADTYMTVGWYHDGHGKIIAYVNDQEVGSVDRTNLPDDEELTISFGVKAGDGGSAKTMDVDYILAVQERP